MSKLINVNKVNGLTIVHNVIPNIPTQYLITKYLIIVVYILDKNFVMFIMNLNKNVQFVKKAILLIMIIFVN